MKLATRLNEVQLLHIAAEVSADVIDFRCLGISRDKLQKYQFRLVPFGKSYQRTSASYFQRGRRVHALCFHGYTRFMQTVFNLDDSARFDSRFGRVTAYNIHDKIVEVGTANIGPPISPVLFCHACNCRDFISPEV